MRLLVAAIALLASLGLAPAASAACTDAAPGVVLCDSEGDAVPDVTVVHQRVATFAGVIDVSVVVPVRASVGGSHAGASSVATLVVPNVVATGAGGGAFCREAGASGECAAGGGVPARRVDAAYARGGDLRAGAASYADTTIDVVGADASVACERFTLNGCYRAYSTAGASAYGDARRIVATHGPGPDSATCYSTGGAWTCVDPLP